MFIFTLSALFILAILKLIVFYSSPYGYISDRLLFYAIPSPKALGIGWFLGVLALFSLFIFLREKLEKLKLWQFLLALYVYFVLFSLGVAAIREGMFSIYEPFTRTHWEYTGDMLLVKNVTSFLQNYISLQPVLNVHASVHPPGYTILLYIFHRYLHAGFAGMAVLTVMLGGLTIVPLYYFLKNFASENTTRLGLQLFIFLPSVVMISATSTEAIFLFASWLAVAVVYRGWKHSKVLSFVGGILAALALFFNYLFLLLGPLFLMLLINIFLDEKKESGLGWPPVINRAAMAFLGLVTFYAIIYFVTGYSIINNFFVARNRAYYNVGSDFESLRLYLIYLFMNIAAFAVYLGLPSLKALTGGAARFIEERDLTNFFGVIIVGIALLAGVFQAETERLWLFLTPLFTLPLMRLGAEMDSRRFSSFLSLLFFQIIFIQILFYTYW